MRLIPVVSDIQTPLHDERAVAAIATFLADRNLDSVCVGDAIDSAQVSRWSKGTAGEFDGKLHEAREATIKVLRDLRVRHLSRSNHDERIETYVRRYAPALESLPELKLEQFLRLDSINCEFHRQPFEVAPGWLLMHGDEGSLIMSAGGTALNIAKRTARSVVCGHTHRMGLQHFHSSYSGIVTHELWGFEVGHVMDMSKASYLSAGYANWQQGFGVLVVDGTDVMPIPVPIRDGKLYFDGKVYSA